MRNNRAIRIFIGLGVAVFGSLFALASPVYAATAESCFDYMTIGSDVYITNYYDNEGNNAVNPACPRAVDIPITIG